MQHPWGPPQYPASHAPYGTLVAFGQIRLFQQTHQYDSDDKFKGSTGIKMALNQCGCSCAMTTLQRPLHCAGGAAYGYQPHGPPGYGHPPDQPPVGAGFGAPIYGISVLSTTRMDLVKPDG